MSRRRASKRLNTTPLISAKLLAISSATIALARLLFIATLNAMPCAGARAGAQRETAPTEQLGVATSHQPQCRVQQRYSIPWPFRFRGQTQVLIAFDQTAIAVLQAILGQPWQFNQSVAADGERAWHMMTAPWPMTRSSEVTVSASRCCHRPLHVS